MSVEPRRQLNGKYRIMMDEDILQAIFLHYIGITWSVLVKKTLRDVIRYTSVWKHNIDISQEESDKRRFYLREHRSDRFGNVKKNRQETYRCDFFLSQVPSSVYEGAGGYDDDEDYGDHDDDDETDAPGKSPKQIKQHLLRQLATGVLIQKSLDGEVAAVQSDFQWFPTSISHSILHAVMEFVGIPED